MAKVILTANLQKYYPQRECEIAGNTVFEIISKMDEIRPHFKSYIFDEHNNVRQHVNIFIDNELIGKNKTDTVVNSSSTLHLMQALSGG